MKTYHKRKLPHLEPPGGTFFVTTLLDGALSRPVIQELSKEKQRILNRLKMLKEKEGFSEADYRDAVLKAQNDYLDELHEKLTESTGLVHHLKDPKVAQILADKFKQYDGLHYRLESYCIMSNHFHLLIDTSIQLERLAPGEEPNDENYKSLSKIMQLIKGGSAFLINKHLARRGTFWEEESYDHWVRNEKAHQNIHHYILNNPVKARLVAKWEDFPFSYSQTGSLEPPPL